MQNLEQLKVILSQMVVVTPLDILRTTERGTFRGFVAIKPAIFPQEVGPSPFGIVATQDD